MVTGRGGRIEAAEGRVGVAGKVEGLAAEVLDVVGGPGKSIAVADGDAAASAAESIKRSVPLLPPVLPAEVVAGTDRCRRR